ncbi:MAG: GGDEF domain-containing protein [Rhodoferax sp.]|uniref:GGDEF domain-containing protein n=1 Tax=Rhodoferax sp. TaxID=50421 RepID=UPI003264202F
MTQSSHLVSSSFAAQTLEHLRPMVKASQTLGIFFCLLVLLVKDFYSPPAQLGLYGWVLLALVGLAIAFRCQSLKSLAVADSLTAISVSAGLSSLAPFTPSPETCFITIGLVMTITSPPLYANSLHFVGSRILIWCLLAWLVPTPTRSGLEQILLWLVVVGSLCAGLLSNIMFIRLRRDAYALQLQLHEAAFIDSLTGIPNRRAFLLRLEQVLQTLAADQTLFFMMLDVDDFKKVNDDFGHPQGDAALIDVAQGISTHAASHSFGRLGGEEFAVAAVLDAARAQALAQCLVQDIHTRTVLGRPLSISIGVASWRNTEALGELMRRADQALYQAKRQGKNRYLVIP